MNVKKGNRLLGDFPKVGIRRVIDGRRRGVRESIEDQTMNMAKSAAKLISKNLKYPDGSDVVCVISDTSIGGVAEAAACADQFAKAGVGVSLTVTPCWCYGSETMDMDPYIPKAVWGFNGTERPGAVYLAAVLAAHAQKGLPAFGIYGHEVQDAADTTIPGDVQEKILKFVKAGLATAYMKGKSYLSIGSVSMGIAGSIVNPDFFQTYLGMRNEYVDMSEVQRRLKEGIYDPVEFEHALAWTKKNCNEGTDLNPPQTQKTRKEKDLNWEECVKMAMITRDLMIGNPRLHELGFYEEAMGRNALVSGFQGQRHWNDFMTNGDFMEAILNSSFDWTGIRQPFIIATENDCLNGDGMMLGYLLTNTAQAFADVRTYWSPDAVKRVTGYTLEGVAQNGLIHLINSGSAALDATGQQSRDQKPVIKPFWEITNEEADQCLKATSWRPASLGYFRGGGYSSNFKSKGGMPLTMCRLNLIRGLGPVLQIAEGFSAELPDHVHSILDNRTDPTWPTTWFAPRVNGEGAFKDVYSVMANWGANHGAFSYGHIGAELITLASMLRIPVSMHNVPDDKIFRPAMWNAFGTKDLESADYRACGALGPIYK